MRVHDAGSFAEFVKIAKAMPDEQQTGAMKMALGLSTAHDNFKEAVKVAGSFAELVKIAEGTPCSLRRLIRPKSRVFSAVFKRLHSSTKLQTYRASTVLDRLEERA